jgi:hypothetical protein
MQEVGRSLGMGGGAEDEPLIALQHRQPMLDVGGVILPWGELQPEVGAEEG